MKCSRLASFVLFLSIPVGQSSSLSSGRAEPRRADNEVEPPSGSPQPDNDVYPIVEPVPEERTGEGATGIGSTGKHDDSHPPPTVLQTNQTEENVNVTGTDGSGDIVEARSLDGSDPRRLRNHHCIHGSRRIRCQKYIKAQSIGPSHIHVPSTYGQRPPYRPAVPEVKLFLCNFENHACGMRSQPIVGHYFHRVSAFLAGRRGHYMAVDANRTGYGVTRLITPYLPGYEKATACLSFNFIISGPGASKIQMIAQDRSNRPLFVLEQNAHRWEEFSVHMDVPQDVRFFIEAYTTDKGSGVIAIDNFIYYFGQCLEPARISSY